MKLTLNTPAARWGEAFPLGNGNLGAMVYGGIACERIDLTENTFFSGSRGAGDNTSGASDAFYKMRAELEAGDYAEAHETAKAFIGRRGNYGSHLPTGALYVRFCEGACPEADGCAAEDKGIEASGSVTVNACCETGGRCGTDGCCKVKHCHASGNSRKAGTAKATPQAAQPDASAWAASAYVRSLDLETGTAFCEYKTKTGSVRRRAWASNPANVMVYEINADAPFAACMRYENYTAEGSVTYARSGDNGGVHGEISFETRAVETLHCDAPSGVRLTGLVRAETDGSCTARREALCVENATRLVLWVAMETDFGANGAQTPEKRAMRAAARITCAAKAGANTIWQAHAADVHALMARCTLDLRADSGEAGGAQAVGGALQAQSRQARAKQGNNAEAQIQLDRLVFQFQYGRYLLLSASRENSVLPAHLQGIWNDNVACRIGWTCDMHLDINTQMNYWPAEVTNLSETTVPLFAWIQNDLVKNGVASAQNNYGLPGWVAEIVSNAWGFTAPYWAVPIAPYPTGGAWIATHLWEHYLAGQDMAFLEEQAFPILESAAHFFAGYVFDRGDGVYTCGPSVSPENSFFADGAKYFISNGCTCEILMIRELFAQYMAACEALKKTDGALYAQVKALVKKLLPYRISPDGTLAEWAHDYPSADPQHRHTSHLLGLFPFAQITPDETPELAQAVRLTLQKRMQPEETWEDTGWARSMLMLYAARLRDGAQAWAHLQMMLSKLREPNGMIIHPPTRGAPSFDNVYELDGNTGLTACVAEMLLQSHSGCVRLLPALPAAWAHGEVRGLRARGGITVDIAWGNCLVKKAVFTACKDTVIRVAQGDAVQTQTLALQADAPFVWEPQS